MVTVREIAEFFLLALGFGVGSFTFLVRTPQAGAGAMKLMASVAGVSIFLSYVLFCFSDGFVLTSSRSIFYALTSLSYLLIYAFHQDEKSALMWALFAVHTVGGLALLHLGAASMGHFLFMLTSALYLGGITFIMTKGHWYLVTPKLSERPLLSALLIIWVVFGVKVITTAWGYWVAKDYFVSFSTLGEGYTFNWLMLSMRVVWGYLIIFVMSVFGWRLVKMRSIQSATGIFYAMTIFVFIGELISSYLLFAHGLYI